MGDRSEDAAGFPRRRDTPLLTRGSPGVPGLCLCGRRRGMKAGAL